MEYPSHTEEDYMKAIFTLTERNKGSASTNDIAKLMLTTPASVSDMIQRLAKKEYFIYEKYHGVHLSQKGIKYVTTLIRRERLWKVFLSSTLKLKWHEISDISNQLKHVKSESMITALDNYLNYPKYDPHGEAIPNSEGRFTLRNQISLNNLNIGEKATLVRVKNHEAAFLQYLDQLDLSIGASVELLQCNDFDHSKEIRINRENTALLSSKTCCEIYVKLIV